MKLLLLYTRDFWMKPSVKSLPEAEETDEEIACQGAVVALVHAEPVDDGRRGKVVTKAIKNIKWVAGKFACRRVVLHFFAHLGKESATPELARDLVGAMAERLDGADYEVTVTPFGYFTQFKMHVAGESLAKVFVEI
ncbi:MAG: hypothetical protein O7J95_00615 [Planctomycetota bacterium]|nr:hypothetical protein [Planctomycetota bacterium]